MSDASRLDEHALLGESGAFQETLEAVSAVAPLDRPVLIIGERGTGKELVASRLHFLSRRWQGPYVRLNCAALTESLLDSELFGHEAGAFTGAARRHTGRFELASGGSLFLDEVANTTPRLQEKILRVVEYGEFERVGSNQTLQTDARLVAATNADLPALARTGAFRADLLDRLAFDVITIPPLRARGGDILLLAEHFGTQMARHLGLQFFPGLSEDARAQLVDYAWPGNVRELKNVIERATYRNPEPEEPIQELQLDPFESPWRPASGGETSGAVGSPGPAPEPVARPPLRVADLKAAVLAYEKEILTRALERNRYHQRRTAEDLALSYDQLRNYLRKHRIATRAPGRA
ncbi:MAG: phage shock protein operon transcriptional activator [Gammaproteobacteria bacterium]|nr:phage shock protein operon transcriptional activator [Gammaproteobacteria bacterium]